MVNGQSIDIHTNNPAEELNYIGDVTTPNDKWYGYPTCFTVWDPSEITDKTFSIGDQFVLAPNTTFNDASCIGQSTPPRLSFQAHSAPLDCKFNVNYTTLYVTFHGSWDRSPPTGYKLVAVPFSKGSNGSYAPTAPANSGSGYTDIWWNSDITQCDSTIMSSTGCFRPVGMVFDSMGRLFVTSDAPAEGELFMLGPATGTTPTTSSSESASTRSTSIISTSATRTGSGGSGTVAHWGQCGGIGWTGGTVCISPYTCTYSNAYYSQCL